MLNKFASVAHEISLTTKKSVKEKVLSEFFQALDDENLERAAVFFTGSPFPARDERVSGVGWSTLADAVAEATGTPHDRIFEEAGRAGDLGDALPSFFPSSLPDSLSLVELGEIFDHLAATSGKTAKGEILTALFRRLTGEEARFVVKILQGEFRIGLQSGLVESALAKAFGQDLEELRRAHMFNGDLGATALLARSGVLHEAEMTLFHPIGFMLAQPEEDPAAIIEQLGEGAIADDKYDGIRAQIHFDGREMRMYSRTLDEISLRFPEIAAAALQLPAAPVVLDGEIVAFKEKILPFATLQKRIGKRKVSEKLLQDAPVSFFAFDILFHEGRPLFETPLVDRLELLARLVAENGVIRRGFQSTVRTAEEVDLAFDAARERINEGLVVKAPDSLYTPGRRGKSWLKYKKALATLDCVVTAAEWGHGKRRGVLSDYTFAVRKGEELLNIGKAYSGLTDVEIEELTKRFLLSTTSKYGPVHVVRPEVVLEIAFDRIQESKRHKSGYALRFPRIANVRHDKTPAEISTLDDVRRIYEGQLRREKTHPESDRGGESVSSD